MNKLQANLEIILDEMMEHIITFVETDRLDDANFLLDQYVKLSPTSVERYSLEALIRAGEADWQRAEEILREGLTKYPLSFDLLYNLGYIYEEKKEILEAYHLYMMARYVAATKQEKTDIGAALKRLVDDIRGSVKSLDGKIATIVQAGEITMTVSTKTEELLKRKELLWFIERQISKNATSVLEIGFKDGIISKNLNYFGYEVTAVDRVKERILNVIAREWHDNILHPEQRVAKFYHEPVDLEWMRKIPEFEVIIAVGERNRAMFNVGEGQEEEVLEALLQKAQKQLFLTVSTVPSVSEFSKENLAGVLAAHGLELEVIATLDDRKGCNIELCLVDKEPGSEPFSIPAGIDVRGSRSTIFEVELARCVDLYGAGFVGDRHHFVEVLQQYAENPELQYEDSVLKDYYDHFKPRNLEEGLFAQKGRAYKLRAGWIGFPWFWNKERKAIFSKKLGETRPGGNHHFGPNTEKFGAAEFGRLLPLYEILKKESYHPELFFDGYISGYMLVKGDDYRFVVTEGQHRVACLAALGYEKIRCRFTQQPQYPRVVVWRDVKKWPQVANGAFGINLALKIFDRFFARGVGRERMETPAAGPTK